MWIQSNTNGTSVSVLKCSWCLCYAVAVVVSPLNDTDGVLLFIMCCFAEVKLQKQLSWSSCRKHKCLKHMVWILIRARLEWLYLTHLQMASKRYCVLCKNFSNFYEPRALSWCQNVQETQERFLFRCCKSPEVMSDSVISWLRKKENVVMYFITHNP